MKEDFPLSAFDVITATLDASLCYDTLYNKKGKEKEKEAKPRYVFLIARQPAKKTHTKGARAT